MNTREAARRDAGIKPIREMAVPWRDMTRSHKDSMDTALAEYFKGIVERVVGKVPKTYWSKGMSGTLTAGAAMVAMEGVSKSGAECYVVITMGIETVSTSSFAQFTYREGGMGSSMDKAEINIKAGDDAVSVAGIAIEKFLRTR